MGIGCGETMPVVNKDRKRTMVLGIQGFRFSDETQSHENFMSSTLSHRLAKVKASLVLSIL